MKELVENLKLSGVLKTPAIIAAFLRADRKRFVPPEFQKDAYRDAPLPIGKGQTISQPATVAFMFELLQAKPGDRVLDIGFGSGWTAALLSEIVGPGGKVFALEVVPEVYEFGKRNLERAGYKNVTTLLRSGSIGLPEHAPFERIIAGAATPKIPEANIGALAPRGRLVIPVGTPYSCSEVLVEKSAAGKIRRTDHPGFAFVPFVET